MNKIEVSILNEAHELPGNMMMFLARLTQRGHNIKSMEDLNNMYLECMSKDFKSIANVVALPHGTIKRFTPITVAVVGASRRFLAQARTHQVGMNFVSASLQYSNYSDESSFTVPYALLDNEAARNEYLMACFNSMEAYTEIAAATDNDTAGYAAPQGLRNVLIIQANHEAWMHFIRTRACRRNTVETRFVATKIWEALLESYQGEEMFKYAGPDCAYGPCKEGAMSCGKPIESTDPIDILRQTWPLVYTL